MLKLYNTLTRKTEDFKPIKNGEVGIYSCGPTVYWNQHIGHMYAYVQWDILVRFLRFSGHKVKWVMNITDVGHMTSDEDTGEDKMEKGAKREGISVWELADKYIDQFKDSLELLNIQKPDNLVRVTDEIKEQIKLTKQILDAGFAYQTKMGIVFDTGKFKDYAKFAHLDLEKLQKREDLEDDPEKKNPSDFFLWITGNKKHVMQWDSPWGKGYPGWHLECTAISTKFLGKKFDIHTGGIEHISIHHTNEIAQGHAAFGGQTANYWLHNAWLLSKEGEKMSKSLGNFLTVQELVEKGHKPLALRYLFLTSHYRKGINFSTKSLQAAEKTLDNLQSIVANLKAEHKDERTALSEDKMAKIDEFKARFTESLNTDLNTPKALSVLWEAAKSNIPSGDKLDLILLFDEVLGLKMSEIKPATTNISSDTQQLINERNKLREQKKYAQADKIREKLELKGVEVKDTK